MKIKVKYIIKIFISCFLLLIILILPVHSENINFIKGKLEEIGIPKEYSKNINEYIENLNINEGEIKKIISDSSEIINDIKGGKSLKEFSLSQLSQIYSDALMLANELGIQVNIDSYNNKFEIKDKKSGEILLICDIKEAIKYYNNYKKSPFTKEEYNELFNYINKEDINENNEFVDDNTKDKIVKSEYESKDDKNINVVNGTQESSRATNKSKIRIMSIIYFILFLCVIVSLIIKGIFVEENWIEI